MACRSSFCFVLLLIAGTFSGCGGSNSTPTAAAPVSPAVPPVPPTPPGAPVPPTAPVPPPAPPASPRLGEPINPTAATIPPATPASGSPDGSSTPSPMPMPMSEIPGAPSAEPAATNSARPTNSTEGAPSPRLGEPIPNVTVNPNPNPNPNPGEVPAPMPGESNNPNPETAKPLSLFEQAAAQYRTGNDAAGQSLLQMYYLSEGGEQIAEQVRWFPALKRPAAVVRWGIGVVYTAPRNFAANPRAIGSELIAGAAAAPQPRPNRPLRLGQPVNPPPASGGGNLPAQPPEDPRGQLAFYTGDLGTYVLDALENRLAEKSHGAVLAAAVEKKDPNQPQAYAQPQPAAALPPLDPAQLGQLMRAIGKDGKIDPRRLPPALAGVDPVALLAAVQKMQQGTADVKPLLPGVSLLGMGTVTELERLAKKLQLDVLLIYTVDVRPSPNGEVVNNTTKFRLTTVTNGEKLFESKPLNNLKVAEERARPKGDDPADGQIQEMLSVVAAKLNPTDLPAGLTAEVAKRRITSLAAEGLPKLMGNMIEMRLYQSKGLVTEDELLAIAGEALGPEALSAIAKAMAGGADGEANLAEALEKVTKKLGEDLTKEKADPAAEEK